jgi:hypothetical protein
VGHHPNPKIPFAAGVLLNIGNYTANATFLAAMVHDNRELSIEG